MNLNESQTQAILALLSDPDPDIVTGMRNKLYELGEEAAQHLLEVSPEGSAARPEVERVLHMFRFPPLEEQFRQIPREDTGDIDLETGVFTLARFGYPDLDLNACITRIDRMTFDLNPLIAPDDHPVRIIRTLNHYLFQEQKFQGAPDYTARPDPDNSYLNKVLVRKIGLPISISTIYLLLARHLELPIVGVDMPGHFIVKYITEDEQEIFIDPYNNGQILTRNECIDIASQFYDGPDIDPSLLLPESLNWKIVVRMMINLIATYQALGNTKKVRNLRRLIRVLQEED